MAIAKPSIKELREIYNGFVSISIASRIDALAKALLWYDNAITYSIAKKLVTQDKLLKLNKATKTRDLGISSTHPEEKETCFKKSLEFYQQICDGLNPPDVNEYFKRFKDERAKLEAEEARVKDKYQPVLDILSEMFAASKFKVSIDPRADKNRMFDGIDRIVYSKAAIKEVFDSLRFEGLLPAMTKEMPLFARAMAIEPDGAGSFVYKADKHAKAQQLLLTEFITFARKDDTRFKLLRYGAMHVPAATNAATGNVATNSSTVQKTAKPKTKSTGTIGNYDPASPIGQVFEKMKTGKVISHADLYKGIQHTAPRTLLAWISIHGKRSGKWVVNKIGKDSVQLVMK